jgi:hypothetical protein
MTTTTAPAVTARYPISRPACGDDPRFCLGLAYDTAQVLTHYGFPPITEGGDLSRLQQALFTFIYQQKRYRS